MKKSTAKGTGQTGERALIVMGGLFLAGAAAGSLCSVRLQGLQNLLLTSSNGAPDLWRALWPQMIYLGVMLTAAFLRQGVPVVWLTMAVKGFLLSAVSTTQILQQGNAGYPLMAARTLLPQFLAVAALVLAGRQAMGWAALQSRLPAGRGRRTLPDGTYPVTAVVCLGLLLLSALLQVRVCPALEAAVCSLLPETG